MSDKKLAEELFGQFHVETAEDIADIDRSKIIDFYKDIRVAMFLNYYKKNPSIDDVDKLLGDAKLDLYDGLKNIKRIDVNALIEDFFSKVLNVRTYLIKDIKAIYDGDPACNSYAEVVLTYPGFIAISAYRIAHILYEQGLKTAARVISEYAHSRTGIDINPGANIGESFFIDHGTGIVIGETAIIGDRVKLYQGVTIGALSLKDADKLRGVKRHPTIEDDVTIYSGASIFGGDTVIGHSSTIGSSAYIKRSIPPYSLVRNKPYDVLEITTTKK
jgi:serine O-acetyltransferase